MRSIEGLRRAGDYRPGPVGAFSILALLSGLCATLPASAQVSGSVDVESDYRYRGYSLSAGEPVVTGELGYDDKSGLYTNLSVTGQLADGGRFLGVEGNIGYARRLSPTVSIDAGVRHAHYDPSYDGGVARNYTEAYIGVAAGRIATHLYFSPNYFHAGVTTLYGEVEGALQPSPKWRISAHVGALGYLAMPYAYPVSRATRYDWRLGVARQLGSFELHAALSGGGPGKEYYSGNVHSRTAVSGGVSWSF